MRNRCSWVSSQNASKRSLRESIGSSGSGEGLEGTACGGYYGGGGDVQKEGRRAMYEPSTGVIGSSGKEGGDGCARLLGFRQWGAQSEEQNGLFLALK